MILKNCCFYNEAFEKDYADIEITADGKIGRIGIIDEDGTDMAGKTVIPGFIDVHIHGAAGGDFGDADTESLNKMSTYLAKNGITSFCPASMTLGEDELCKILECGAQYAGSEAGAKIAGFHIEGPFISKAKKGAQNEKYIRPGTIEEFKRLNSCAGGKIKIITIAPEAFESNDFIKYVKGECAVSLGHSSANACECKKAVNAGITHATHLYNAMTPMTHREAGAVGALLDSEGVMCEIICDGGHICPAVIRNTFKILGENRAIVISDSMKAAGLGTGVFDLGGQEVFVNENAKYAVLKDGTIAASISNIYLEFKNLISWGIDFKTALKSCTINPARSIGKEHETGSIATGKYADIVALDASLNITDVFINGVKI